MTARPTDGDADCHVCVHCTHVILARESHLILANGRIHGDCYDQITEVSQ